MSLLNLRKPHQHQVLHDAGVLQADGVKRVMLWHCSKHFAAAGNDNLRTAAYPAAAIPVSKSGGLPLVPGGNVVLMYSASPRIVKTAETLT